MNTLLDYTWRDMLKPVIVELTKLCPDMMLRKIPEASVQQAFTYSKTKELSSDISRILSVGSYEDTAYEALHLQGYDIVGIDPSVNMDLNMFFHQNYGVSEYDIIFSTSVLEHVENDELFIEQICKLLKKGGYGILTCDFRDDYKEGDPKPGEDVRLFTTFDLTDRLNRVLIRNNCKMVGPVDYSGEPDFFYGLYHYSFATFMFTKISSE